MVTLARSYWLSDSVGTMNRRFVSAIASRNAALGPFSVKVMVCLSGNSTLSTYLTCAAFALVAAVSRLHEYFTSSEVTWRPLTGAMLWNFTSWRSLNVHFVPSGEASAVCTISGSGRTLSGRMPGPVLYLYRRL